MAAGQWKVAKSKRNRNKSNNDDRPIPPRGQKKKSAEAMPKAEDSAGPIKESPSMFAPFLEKDKKSQPEVKGNGSTGAVKGKEQQQSKKKNQEKKKNQPPVKLLPLSLEKVIGELNAEHIKAHLAASETASPDVPLMWLKDLAVYLNVKLNVDISDPVFGAHPVGYPLCLLSDEIRELIYNTLCHCTIQTLHLFFDLCLQSMVQDMLKGLPTLGYRIFLQCLTQEMPSVPVENFSKCEDYRNSYQNRQNVCLSILWAVGQAGNKDLESGLKVWLNLMFPLLGMRAYSKYVVGYLEKLLSLHANTTSVRDVLGVRELFPVLDFVHSSSGLAPNLQKQLVALYPKLKALSYGSERSNVLRNYFPSYLRRLEPNCSPSLKEEVLNSLVECLTEDRHTYSIWRQLYTKHLAQSSLLMSHLLKEWDSLPAEFPRRLLKETLSTFRVTNEELLSQGKAIPYLKECIACCNESLDKMSSRKFPWGKFLIFLSVVACGLLAYDIQISGSFKSSKTGHFLKETGLLAISEQAWGRIKVYSQKALTWLQINIPIFYAWLRETFGPYIEAFWEKLLALSIQFWKSTQFIRDWFHRSVPPILKLANDNVPYYLEKLLYLAQKIASFLLQQAEIIWKFVSYYLTILISWLHANVFVGSLSPENLQKLAGRAVEVMQHYILHAYKWISQSVSTYIAPEK